MSGNECMTCRNHITRCDCDEKPSQFDQLDLPGFVAESNRIEGILRPPTPDELAEAMRFWCQPEITIADLTEFVRVYEPGAQLRLSKHQSVTVGDHVAPVGGMAIAYRLDELMKIANEFKGKPHAAFRVHRDYLTLHPWTDCNGRSARMLWLWMMRTAPYGFLQGFYYQALSNNDR